MNNIEFRPYDLYIKTIEKTGDEVVQIKNNIAFDKTFIEECKKAGVKQLVLRDSNGDQVED